MPNPTMERITIDLTGTSYPPASIFMPSASQVGFIHVSDVHVAYMPCPIVRPLRAKDYPVLAHLWDNDDDAIYRRSGCGRSPIR